VHRIVSWNQKNQGNGNYNAKDSEEEWQANGDSKQETTKRCSKEFAQGHRGHLQPGITLFQLVDLQHLRQHRLHGRVINNLTNAEKKCCEEQ